jgi:hypothetical protein
MVSINFSQNPKYKILRYCFGVEGVVFFNEDRRTCMRCPVVVLRFPNASVKMGLKYVLVLFVRFGTTFLLEFFVGGVTGSDIIH